MINMKNSSDTNKGSEFSPWPYFGVEEIEVVSNILKSGKVNQWTGQEVYEFEKEYASYIGTNYAIAVSNGSVALDLALIVLGIGPGDEVIVTSRTFVASAHCIALRGAVPVFADVDHNSQNITLESVKRVFTSRTKAIIAVHLAGWPCELDLLKQFCVDNGVFLIEDCAQAHGAKYNDKPVGSFGHMAAFSFCQDKIISTGGEGGLLVTDDKDLWQKAWSYKDHGKDYDLVFSQNKSNGFNWVVKSFGTNYRMTELQAAIGRIALRKLDSWVARRRKFAKILNDYLARIGALRIAIPPDYIEHSYYRYYVFIRPDRLKTGWSRDSILQLLTDRKVPCRAGICPEVYLEKPFAHMVSDRLPVAKELGETSMMFLVHPTLSEENIFWMANQIIDIMEEASI